MKKLYKNAGIRIRFLREERHYTREYLAEMADIYAEILYLFLDYPHKYYVFKYFEV